MAPLTLSDPVTRTARAEFAGGSGYLASCTMGLPSRATRAALIADLDCAEQGGACAFEYGAVVERARASYARIVGARVEDVAIGSQASVQASVIAAAVPAGAEVLCVEGDFSSIVLPFEAQRSRGVRVRHVPLDALADEIGPDTWLVSFSLVQSATGDIADAAAIRAAAGAHGAFTLCDLTQAAGWMPVDAAAFDATICHTYKWLCCPRGVSFMPVQDRLGAALTAVQAGWYAGGDPWASCYGSDAALAATARRFDVSPAWQAFVGAEPALALFARLEIEAVGAHAVGLANAFRARLDLAPADSAIVTWADPSGTDLRALSAAGLVASGRAGRARAGFHLYNDGDDVDRAARALAR